LSNLSSAYPDARVLAWESEGLWNWQAFLALLVLGAASLFSGQNSAGALVFWSIVYVAMVFADWRLATFALVSAAFLFEATRLENGSVAVTEIALVAIGLRVVLRDKPTQLLKQLRYPDLQDVFLSGILILAALSVLWVITGHGDTTAALKSAARYGEYALGYICFSRLIQDRLDLHELEFFMILVAALLALVGIYQHLIGPLASASSFPWGADVTLNADTDSFRIYSVFSNPIFLSAFCAFFVPFSFDRVLHKDFPHRLAYAICFVVICVALVLTSSRTGLAGAVVGLFVLTGKNIKKIVIVAIIATVAVSLFSTDWLENRLAQTGSATDLTGAIRVLKYYRTTLVILEHPIVGVGTGEYQTYFLSEIAPDLPKEGYGELTAENTFLQIGAELGVPGLIVFCALVITILLRSYRLSKLKVPGGRGLFAGMCAFVVSSMFVSMTAVSMVLFMLLLFVLVKRNYQFFGPSAPAGVVG
jgi:O-Antigen ligase